MRSAHATYRFANGREILSPIQDKTGPIVSKGAADHFSARGYANISGNRWTDVKDLCLRGGFP